MLPLDVVKKLTEEFRYNDAEKAAYLFSEDGYLRISPSYIPISGSFSGRWNIYEFFRKFLSNASVQGYNYNWNNNRVIWQMTVSSDLFRQWGIDEVNFYNQAYVIGDQIDYMSMTYSESSIEKFKQRVGLNW